MHDLLRKRAGEDFLVGMTFCDGEVDQVIVADTNGVVLGEYSPERFAQILDPTP